MHRKKHQRKTEEKQHFIGKDQLNPQEKMASLNTESPAVPESLDTPKVEAPPMATPIVSAKKAIPSRDMAKFIDMKDEVTRLQTFVMHCQIITHRVGDFFKKLF